MKNPNLQIPNPNEIEFVGIWDLGFGIFQVILYAWIFDVFEKITRFGRL